MKSRFATRIRTLPLYGTTTAASFALGLLIQGCTPSSNSSMVDKSLITHSYTSEGEIVSLPKVTAAEATSAEDAKTDKNATSDQRKPLRFVKIRHKAMPGFKNKKGVVVGMTAMAMSFAIPKEISLKEFKRGDQVRFSFDSVWRATPRHQITNIAPLAKTGAR